MANGIKLVDRPKRWQTPFGPDMSDVDIDRILASKPFSSMDQDKFPASTSLRDIIRFDARIIRAEPGQIILREGEYGNSAFAILSGQVQIVLGDGLPPNLLGRSDDKGKSYAQAFAQLWQNNKHAEARKLQVNTATDSENQFVVLKDLNQVFNDYKCAPLPAGQLFGELAALGRMPRTASVFVDQPTKLLEIRWQGIREISRFNAEFKQAIDTKYRENALRQHLQATDLFTHAPDEAFEEIVASTLFETHGSFDWYLDYKSGKRTEPVIASEGDYPDGLLLVRAGFARVYRSLGSGQQTLTYLSAGDLYGFHEVYDQSQGKESRLETSLSALGYVDLIRIPLPLLEKYVFPHMTPPEFRLRDHKNKPLENNLAEDWLVYNRFINATAAMVIDLDSCVRCDDCVRACASTHDGNPRFKRHGKVFDNWMVTNACMHCIDPVCMIGCPTGAIHRSAQGGEVIINDDTCIGCGTCAASCPYDNITVVEIADGAGRAVVDPVSHKPIQKATKCDLCHTNPGGPACVQACPHDALFRVDFDTINPLNKV
ncbi:MAG: cyclic nucleotide-binding domain-containing protein [Gammaproteobacteria bacterium]|nr:cyclic nucleotide-binding domain-containing protein [Gammaproteobacteria bacterium]